MAKSKEKKPKPKPPEGVKTVIEIKKELEARTSRLTKAKEAATKDGKLEKYNPKYRIALKRVKRAQRKLGKEAVRLKKVPQAKPAEAAAPAAEAAPAQA